MSRSTPFFRKALRLGLIGAGSIAIVSAVVNIFTTWKLMEPTDEESLGITRNEITLWFAALIVIGVALIYLGVRQKKS